MTKLTVAFRNFANEPKNEQILDTSNLSQTPIMLSFLWFSTPTSNVDIES